MADNIILSQIPASELFDLIKQAVKEVLDIRDNPILEAPNKERPISQKELCAFLQITNPTALRWRRKGKIPFLQIGTAVRFNLQDVLKSLGKK